jgi:hypothetical protein
VKIILNGSIFPITYNLEQALRSLRDGNGGSARTLWVDAICIHQSNISERNHQVAQMPEIYSGATRVNFWSGQAMENSDMAIAFMFLLHDSLVTSGKYSTGSLRSWSFAEQDFRDIIGRFQRADFDDHQAGH